MSAIDKNAARAIQAESLAALKVVFEKHGLTIVKGHVTYDAGMIRLSTEAHAKGTDNDPRLLDWARYAASYNLPVDALGTDIVVGGSTYTIDGLIPSRPKFPVAVKRTDGKSMLLTVSAVKRALGLTVSEWDR